MGQIPTSALVADFNAITGTYKFPPPLRTIDFPPSQLPFLKRDARPSSLRKVYCFMTVHSG